MDNDSPTSSPNFLGLLRILTSNRLALAGSLLLALLILLALVAPILTRTQLLHEPSQQHEDGLDEYGLPVTPGAAYFLGTDELGRDILSRTFHGASVSLGVGISAMLTAVIIGVAVGLLAGFYGGKVDMLLMRLTEINMTIPSVLLAIAFAALMDGRIIHLHPSGLEWHVLDLELKRGLVSVFIIIGLVCWPGMVRVVRAQVLSLKEREFVLAAQALGASDRRVILLHILPNLLPTIIVLAAMNTSFTILLEAGLGYLGVGVPPPAPSWGSMIAEGQAYFLTSPHLVIIPGLAIVVTVVAFNLLGQGLQEVIDPRYKK